MSGGAPAAPSPVAPTYTDPVNGMTFTDQSSYAYPTGSPLAAAANGLPGNTTTFSGANALNAEIANREATDQATSDANKALAAQIQAQNETQFQTDRTTGLNNATTGVNQYFTDNGYDPTKYSTQIASAIQNAGNAIVDPATGQTTAAVPSYLAQVTGGLSPNLGAQILQQINSGVQSTATNQISNEFAPTYAQDNVSNDWLAPAASSALSAQFDPLSAQLLNADKRGTLNDTGYNAALTALGNAKTAATSTVNNLGTNILANDRTGVDNYITGAKNDAAGLNANTVSSFDPNSYASGASNLVNQDKNNFAGDLTNAIGSTQFSSLGDLLNAGGVVQGANNPTATNPNGAPGSSGVGIPGAGAVSDAYIAQQALANQQRGLGSSGAF